jgi:hypothetical protein
VFETAIISSVLKLCKSENSKEQLTALSVVEKLSDDSTTQKRFFLSHFISLTHTHTHTVNNRISSFCLCLFCSLEHCYQKLLKAGVIQILVDIISLEATQVKDQDIIQKRQQRALTSIKNFLENDGLFPSPSLCFSLSLLKSLTVAEFSFINFFSEELYVEFIKVGLIPLLWNITLKQNQSSERKLSTQILELLSQNGTQQFKSKIFVVCLH